jgi:hypothetical protein
VRLLISANHCIHNAETMSWRKIISSRHFPYLVIGVVVPALALSLTVVDGSRVAFRFLPYRPLPQSCVSRALFSFDCPACGLTRSIVMLVEGRFADSLSMHRLGWFIFLIAVAQVPYRAWCLSGRHPRLVSTGRLEPYWWIALLILLVLNRAWDFFAAV